MMQATFILTALDLLLDPNFIAVPTVSPALSLVDMICSRSAFATCLIWYRVDVTAPVRGVAYSLKAIKQ